MREVLELQLALFILHASVSHLEKEEENGRLRLVQNTPKVQSREDLLEWHPDSRILY